MRLLISKRTFRRGAVGVLASLVVLGLVVSAALGAGSAKAPAAKAPVLNYAKQTVSGFRLQDGRASYGLGLETFALGFPIHFDWSWRTLFNKPWEDFLFASDGGSSKFRKPRFAVWIGYDF